MATSDPAEHLRQRKGYNVYPTTRTIDNFILNFRKYFEEDSRNPVYFHSARGVGYRFVEGSDFTCSA